MSHQKVSLSYAQSFLYTLIDNQSIQIISILGIGAYGVVYLGQNLLNNKYYAVKLLLNSNNNHREADLHAGLSRHPNILRFEKIVNEGGKTFIVLEYASEGDLFSAITKNKKWIVGNNEAIKHIFLQIIDAVEFCHQNNIAHRDLKPENILLSSHLQIKLADFGLATTDHVSSEFGCGSTFYFSPECQGAGGGAGLCKSTRSVDNKTIRGYNTQKNDIWSLGVILINLTAGRNPWKQASLKNPTFAAYVRSPQHFFKTILPCISDELEKILLRIFCLNPVRRLALSELRTQIQKCQSFVQPSISHKKSSLMVTHNQQDQQTNHYSYIHHLYYQNQHQKSKRRNINIFSQYHPYSTSHRNTSYTNSMIKNMSHYVRNC